MDYAFSKFLRVALAVLFLALPARSADPESPPISAEELAARLSAVQQDGNSYVRLRMEIQQPSGSAKSALQVQIKSRRTKTSVDVVCQILWPKERKGEAVLLRKAKDQFAGGSIFVPPDSVRSLSAAQMTEPLFGSDLSYEDLVDAFFSWEHQTLAGSGEIDGTPCAILESKPGKTVRSPYSSVRTWVDTRRLLPLRIEKRLNSGQTARRIETINVATDDLGRKIPASMAVRGPQGTSVTMIDGSRIKHDVSYDEDQFTLKAIREITVPHSGSE